MGQVFGLDRTCRGSALSPGEADSLPDKLNEFGLIRSGEHVNVGHMRQLAIRAVTVVATGKELYAEPLRVLSVTLLVVDIDRGKFGRACNGRVELQETHCLPALEVRRVGGLLGTIATIRPSCLLALRVAASGTR